MIGGTGSREFFPNCAVSVREAGSEKFDCSFRSHQRLFNLIALHLAYQDFNEAQSEIHGGTGAARGDDVAILHYRRLLILYAREVCLVQ